MRTRRKTLLLTVVLYMIVLILNCVASPDNSTVFDENQAKYVIYDTFVSSYVPMLILIIFGVIALYLEYKLVCSGKWDPTDSTRFMGLTTIVILTVFVVIIAKSIESALMTAMIGFLGTIAGYLAGSSKQIMPSVEPANPPANPPADTSVEPANPPANPPADTSVEPANPPANLAISANLKL